MKLNLILIILCFYSTLFSQERASCYKNANELVHYLSISSNPYRAGSIHPELGRVATSLRFNEVNLLEENEQSVSFHLTTEIQLVFTETLEYRVIKKVFNVNYERNTCLMLELKSL